MCCLLMTNISLFFHCFFDGSVFIFRLRLFFREGLFILIVFALRWIFLFLVFLNFEVSVGSELRIGP
jgi:hypothetical protein